MTTPNVGSSTSSTATVVPRKAPPFKMKATSANSNHLTALIYGAPGAGKTTLAGSFVDVADDSQVLYINAESGDMVFNDNDRILHPERLTIVNVNRFVELISIYEFITSYVKLKEAGNHAKMIEQEEWLRGMEHGTLEKPTFFTSIVIDTITEVELYCFNHLLGIHDKFDGINIDPDMKTAEFSEYKKNNNMMNTLIRHFRDLPFNLIVLAHEKWEQDEMKRFHYMPRLTGQLRDQCQGYFDIVGRLVRGQALENGDIPRRLWVQPAGKFDAKCRRASFKGSHFDDPTMTTVLDGLGMRSKK